MQQPSEGAPRTALRNPTTCSVSEERSVRRPGDLQQRHQRLRRGEALGASAALLEATALWKLGGLNSPQKFVRVMGTPGR